LLSYGISVDKEAEARDRVKQTAARVGLSVLDADYSFDLRDASSEAMKRK
jgi:hypothetical protein